MTRLGEHTVVLVVREPTGTRDRYGVAVTVDRYTVVEGCEVAPRSSSEAADQSAAIVTGRRLFAPAGQPIGAADAIIWPPTATDNPAAPWTGPRWEVDGEVADWGELVEVQLQKAT